MHTAGKRTVVEPRIGSTVTFLHVCRPTASRNQVRKSLASPTCHTGCLPQGGAALPGPGTGLRLRSHNESRPLVRKSGKSLDRLWPVRVEHKRHPAIDNQPTRIFVNKINNPLLHLTRTAVIEQLETSHVSFLLIPFARKLIKYLS